MDERDVNIIIALTENRMNVSEVARTLFMHRNTVDYHIRKIKRITGLDPCSFYDLHKLLNMVCGKRCEYCRGASYTDKPFTVITQMGREVEVQFNYCPNCGAKMDGDGNG